MLNSVGWLQAPRWSDYIWRWQSHHIPLKFMVIDDVYLVGAYLIHTSRHASIRFHTLPSSDIVRYGSDLPSCGHHFPLRCPILDFALAGHIHLENCQEITKLKGNCKKHWGSPIHGWLTVENTVKRDDLGVPLLYEISLYLIRINTVVWGWFLNPSRINLHLSLRNSLVACTVRCVFGVGKSSCRTSNQLPFM